MGQKQTKKSDSDPKKDKKGIKKEETPSPTPTTLVFNVDIHCDGCASKIVKCLRGFQGVESLKPEIETGKFTVTGNVDPAKLTDKLTSKMKKSVHIVSSLPNKDKENKPKNNDKKPKDKEAPVTTAVLKVTALCPCQGCSDRICRAVLKNKGVHDVGVDREKGMVMVKGTVDATALAGKLSQKFRRKVEVVPTNKEKEKGKEKEKESEKEGHKGENGSAKKKKKGGNGGSEGDNHKVNEGCGNGQGKTEQNVVNYTVPAYGYGYGYGEYYNYTGQYLPVSQMFSDENPYACHIM